MYFKQFLDEHCGCASYLVASRQSHEAVIVDPAFDIDAYSQLLTEREFELKYVIDTHVHADHLSGARKLSAVHGAPVCLHESAGVVYPFEALRDGQELALGPLRLRVLHTPGHRAELISLLVINPPRSPEASMVLTGDSLLVGDVGRPDFGGGDPSAQYESLGRLLRLPDWVAVFPGHFEGPCGKGMCGRPSTTIGFERLFNPLARQERAAFVASLTSGIPARPLNMIAIEATNRGVAYVPNAMLRISPRIEEMAPVDALREAGLVTLDVREPEEYAHGHAPGAINVPQCELAMRLEEIPRDRRLATVCQVGMRSRRSAQFLVQADYRQVRSIGGGMDSWVAAGLPLDYGDTTVTRPPIMETTWAHAGSLII